ncbi:MAG: DUF4168 domain-containing protein [Elainellaceae cyanobacterium]
MAIFKRRIRSKALPAVLGVVGMSALVCAPAWAQLVLSQKSDAEALSQVAQTPDPDMPAGDASDLEAPDTEPTAPDAQPAPAETEPVEQPASPSESPAEADPISSEEIQQFANVVPDLQAIQQTAEEQVVAVIEESGLSRERFSEIFQAQESPEMAPEADVSPEEAQSFNDAYAQIQSIETEITAQREQVLETAGLDPERFNEILVAVQQDPSLRQQVQELLQN